MSRLPILSGKEIVKVLSKIGYREIRQRGSYVRLFCPHKKFITIPNHKVLGRGLLRRILRDTELSIKDFRNLL
ncbi:MAG: type II toxin-antitoxin system HicA family toxin [Pseudomonadota bacterium]